MLPTAGGRVPGACGSQPKGLRCPRRRAWGGLGKSPARWNGDGTQWTARVVAGWVPGSIGSPLFSPPLRPLAAHSRTRGGQGSSSAPSSSRRAPASTRCPASKSTRPPIHASPLGSLAHRLPPSIWIDPRAPARPSAHRFDHPPEAIQQTLQLQSTPYPVRPGELQCAYYLKTGKCKFGATCRFDHPPMAPEQGARAPSYSMSHLVPPLAD